MFYVEHFDKSLGPCNFYTMTGISTGKYKTQSPGFEANILRLYSRGPNTWIFKGYIKEENMYLIHEWDSFGNCLTHPSFHLTERIAA